MTEKAYQQLMKRREEIISISREEAKLSKPFKEWFLKSIPNAEITSTGKLKVLAGNIWVKFTDLPEPMQRGVFADFSEYQLDQVYDKYVYKLVKK